MFITWCPGRVHYRCPLVMLSGDGILEGEGG
jgi:hypothetical protein